MRHNRRGTGSRGALSVPPFFLASSMAWLMSWECVRRRESAIPLHGRRSRRRRGQGNVSGSLLPPDIGPTGGIMIPPLSSPLLTHSSIAARPLCRSPDTGRCRYSS